MVMMLAEPAESIAPSDAGFTFDKIHFTTSYAIAIPI